MSNGDTPQSPIPAINGSCPDGYVYDPTSDQCFFVSPPVSVTSTGVSLPDVDPKNAGELTGLGTQNSGLPERFALAIWMAFIRLFTFQAKTCGATLPQPLSFVIGLVAGLISVPLTLYDYAVCLGTEFLGRSATRNNPGFWALIGGLISDLLGVELDGGQLYNELQAHGTLPAMQGVGAALVNLLIGEFTGTAGGQGGQVTFSSDVDPSTGLPVATLTPAGGVKAAQALMGFVLSSAVRQGNLEAVGAEFGFLAGHVEKFSEAMRTNLGIGRMLRFALRPIFQDLVAAPLKWAVNKQYRPTLLNAQEASAALLSGNYDAPAFAEETALAGLSDARAKAVLAQHTRKPDINHLLILRAAGVFSDAVFDGWMGRIGYDAAGSQWTRAAADLEPARRVALALAEHYLLEFGKGQITQSALKDFIDGLRTAGFLLTPGEVQALESTAGIVANVKGLRVRHLSTGQLQRAYIDGTISLDQYEQHLTELGYSASDVQTLGIEVLIAAKKAAAAAAKQAAAGKKGSGVPPTTTPPPTPSAGG